MALSADPSVQVAVVGILGTLITTAGVIIVAVLTNRRSRADSMEEEIEASLRDRIRMRDDQIADLRYDRDVLRDRLEDASLQRERDRIIIRRLREELSEDEQGRSD